MKYKFTEQNLHISTRWQLPTKSIYIFQVKYNRISGVFTNKDPRTSRVTGSDEWSRGCKKNPYPLLLFSTINLVEKFNRTRRLVILHIRFLHIYTSYFKIYQFRPTELSSHHRNPSGYDSHSFVQCADDIVPITTYFICWQTWLQTCHD